MLSSFYQILQLLALLHPPQMHVPCEFHVHIPLKCMNGIEFLLEGEEIYYWN
jgi:hypothetical protein